MVFEIDSVARASAGKNGLVRRAVEADKDAKQTGDPSAIALAAILAAAVAAVFMAAAAN